MLGSNPEAAEALQGGALAPGVGLQVESLPLIGLGIWLPSALGILMLLPPVRRLWARIIPIDSESPVHAVALSLSMLVVVNLLLTLGVGLGNLTRCWLPKKAMGHKPTPSCHCGHSRSCSP